MVTSDEPAPIPFVDVQALRDRLGPGLDDAIQGVLAHGQFILGPEVAAFEAALAAHTGAAHAISCANGTDALTLALMAAGVGQGDAVFVPAFTFVATAEAPALVGASPFFVDVDPDTFVIAPASLEAAVAEARDRALNPRAVIAVDLFGLSADYARLRAIADRENLILVADGAQSFGGRQGDQRVGTLADHTTLSFFPAKPLGCYGDGGAVLTNDGERAELMRSLRIHGKGRDKYDNIRIGMNSRLDTLQAAILLQKLSIFDEEHGKRQVIAQRYLDGLGNAVKCQRVPEGSESAWAYFTLVTSHRDQLARELREHGIPTAVYYPIALHQQKGYQHYPHPASGLPVAEELARGVLSLPMHPYLTPLVQDRIIGAVREITGDLEGRAEPTEKR